MKFVFVFPPVTLIEYFAFEMWLSLKILLLVLEPSTTIPRSPFAPLIVFAANVLDDAPFLAHNPMLVALILLS